MSGTSRRAFFKNSIACATLLTDTLHGQATHQRFSHDPEIPAKEASPVNAKKLHDSMAAACQWLVNIAQVKTETIPGAQNPLGYKYRNWAGAIRNEYSVAGGTWSFFGPIWHTGQAIQALVRAGSILGNASLIHAAEASAIFIGNQRITDKKDSDYGLILAFEDLPDVVNTSAILEGIGGLMLLSEVTGRTIYLEWAVDAAHWVADRAYCGDGLFRDSYSIKSRRFVPPPWKDRVPPHPGRPLADDAIFLRLARQNQDPHFRKIFYASVDRLLRDEDPPGNWINYAPCNPKTGMLHPRQAYWWGYPMLAAYQDSGDRKYLECAVRAGEWYLQAMRLDGGMFRHTRKDFKTTSFGLATSGIGCACKLWHGLWLETRDSKWRTALHKALQFQTEVQFVNPRDLNLKGAVLEKTLLPDGTDRSPYHVRDLASIFFVQAAALENTTL